MRPHIDSASHTPPSANDLDATHGGCASRKRAREPTNLEDIFDEPFDLNDDGRPKTRRVNPQRLAVRLGPDLVAEMEALIVPGAKMPPFAVRKDFQERYCVDRRHIYDYFHSRGLRVSKEDKHTNLIRGRAAKAAAAAAATATSASTVATSDVVTSTISAQISDPLAAPKNEIMKAPPQRLSVGPKYTKSMKIPRRKKPEPPKARRTFLAPAIGDTSSRESTISPISEPTFSLGSTPSLEDGWMSQDSSRHVTPGEQKNCVAPQQDSSDRTYLGPQGQILEFVAPLMDSGLDLLLGAGGPPGLLDSGYFPLVDGEISAQVDPPSLDQAERTALYNLVQNSLHPGTVPGDTGGLSFYEAHMKEWALFSGRLATLNAASSYYRPMVNQHISEYTLASTNSGPGDLSSELFDLRGWLSDDVSREEGQASSMTRHSNPSSAATFGGTRAVYLGRYDGYSESVQMNIRENPPLSGKQAKAPTAESSGGFLFLARRRMCRDTSFLPEI